MSKLGWGDAVHIKAKAPPELHPGARGSISGVREVEKGGHTTTFYLVDLSDGETVEIPESWVEPAQ